MKRNIQCPINKKIRVAHIRDFWDVNINGEIYLRQRPDIKRGTLEYFEFIKKIQKEKFGYWYKEVYEFLENCNGNRMLDVGCGIGCDIMEMFNRKFNVHGIDLSPVAIDLAKQYFKLVGVDPDVDERVNIRVGDAENLPYSDNFFDCVHSGVLQHTVSTKTGINELYRVLKPGGRAFILLYHRHSLNYFVHWLLNKGFENVDDPDGQGTYAWHFTMNEFTTMCNKFSKVNLKIDYLFGGGWGIIYDLFPKLLYMYLGKRIGWFLMAYCIK